MKFSSTKVLELGSCAFRQPKAKSHCKFLHGYRLTAKFWFGANQLDEHNWVVDFGSFDHLKKLLRDQFDHTTVIDKNDPDKTIGVDILINTHPAFLDVRNLPIEWRQDCKNELLEFKEEFTLYDKNII